MWGLRFGVWGLRFGVCGLGFGVWGLGFGVWGLGFEVWGSRFTATRCEIARPRAPGTPAREESDQSGTGSHQETEGTLGDQGAIRNRKRGC